MLSAYTFVERLGAGGMAQVHLARAPAGRIVAIKQLAKSADAETAALMLDEARLVTQLDHPNVASIYDVGLDEDGRTYLAMEFVHGKDLYAIMQRTPDDNPALPLPVALCIVMQAAAGLDHAHRRTDAYGNPLAIVHRDISLTNIMVGYDGIVKVVDFGIARSALSTVHTQPGIVRGKASYMSPEQCRGEPVDHRTDVFALGIVLYELTTGMRCFSGDSDHEKMIAITRGRYHAPSSLSTSFPPELEAVIRKALAVDKDARYQTCAQLIEALRDVMRMRHWSGGCPQISEFVNELCGDEALTSPRDRSRMARGSLAPNAQTWGNGVELAIADEDVMTRGRSALRSNVHTPTGELS